MSLPPDVLGILLVHHSRAADTVRVLDLARQRKARLPLLSRFTLWRWRRVCVQLGGHCWHPADVMIAWECCCCPAERDGIPEQRCTRCEDVTQAPA